MHAVTAVQTAAGSAILQEPSTSLAQVPLTSKVADTCPQHEHSLLNNPGRQGIVVTHVWPQQQPHSFNSCYTTCGTCTWCRVHALPCHVSCETRNNTVPCRVSYETRNNAI